MTEGLERLRKVVDSERWAKANICAGQNPPMKEGWVGLDYKWYITTPREVNYRLLEEELSAGWFIPIDAFPQNIPPWVREVEAPLAKLTTTSRIWVNQGQLPEFLGLFHPSQPGKYNKTLVYPLHAEGTETSPLLPAGDSRLGFIHLEISAVAVQSKSATRSV
jgi:hypothetical protein